MILGLVNIYSRDSMKLQPYNFDCSEIKLVLPTQIILPLLQMLAVFDYAYFVKHFFRQVKKESNIR